KRNRTQKTFNANRKSEEAYYAGARRAKDGKRKLVDRIPPPHSIRLGSTHLGFLPIQPQWPTPRAPRLSLPRARSGRILPLPAGSSGSRADSGLIWPIRKQAEARTALWRNAH